MKLVKAEILWTRKCPLKCPYCAMSTRRGNSRKLDEWKKGLDNLDDLGCRFIAIYGAEPLADFVNLPNFIRYAEGIGISTTIITSCAVPNIREKLDELIDYGATSLSVSYDMLGVDHWTNKKLGLGLQWLKYFRDTAGKQCRDVAAIATVHRFNYHLIPETIKKMTKQNIWFMFDFLHPDRANPGTKCKSTTDTPELLFSPHRYAELRDLVKVMQRVRKMKNEGYMVHFSETAIQMIEATNGECVTQKYNWSPWNCAYEESFPALVTIDCDGRVYPCDDFQPKSLFDMTTLHEQFEEFTRYWNRKVEKECKGCLWNTHLSAFDIKDGKERFNDYIHKSSTAVRRGD